ncbi:MAG: TIGR02587 family membrane protein [Chloroflexia bacterium]|nr:TIGR02587 family membrane protein [Chloroflexia bacterium]
MSEELTRADWRRERDDLLRALSGGFLIGTPLIYTMETWTAGAGASTSRVLLFVGIAFLVNLLFIVFAGFRSGEAGARRPLGDALEATAIALVTSGVSLALVHQFELGQPLNVTLGLIAVDAMPIAFGISVANHLLGQEQGRDQPGEGERGHEDAEREFHGIRALLLDAGAAFAGALFLSFNIAPTDEVPMLASEIPSLGLPLIALFSLALSYAIVFAAGFSGQDRRLRTRGPFQRPLTETAVSYVTALFASVAMLLVFGQIEVGMSWTVVYAQVVVLGLPASIGAAAGRLAV